MAKTRQIENTGIVQPSKEKAENRDYTIKESFREVASVSTQKTEVDER